MADDDAQTGRYSAYLALKLTLENGVMTVMLSNPARKNALTPRMLDELTTVWQDLAADPAVQVIVLTGDGRDFCAGADLSQIDDITGRNAGAPGEGPDHRRGHVERPHVLCVVDCPKPTLAKVRGVAYGLGVNLALACDMVFVSQEARLCDSHVKAGMVAGDGGVLLWPLLVGMHRAKEYLMTGEPIPGPVAAEMGLVNRCVADDRLDIEVEAMAQKLLGLPPIAVNRTKMALNLAMRQMTGPAFETSHAWELLSITSEDFGEATRAFVEKRKGVYTGR
jgi:enoyl-CoA hydratase